MLIFFESLPSTSLEVKLKGFLFTSLENIPIFQTPSKYQNSMSKSCIKIISDFTQILHVESLDH